jgi:hypothetical protein
MADRDEDEQRGRSFKVQDRRRFADVESGEHPAEREEPAAEQRAAEAGAHQAEQQGEAAAGAAEREADAHGGLLPEMTFSTFVMGLTTQALMHLGEIADPVGQQVGRDLPAAKQMIDLLGILSDKTKGNLDAAEEQLLGSMLYDLRMRYVEVARGR